MPSSGGSRSAQNPEEPIYDLIHPQRGASRKGRMQSRRMLRVNNSEGAEEEEQ